MQAAMTEPVLIFPVKAALQLSDEADRWIEKHLATWARWMRRDRDELAVGLPRRSPVLIGFTHEDGRRDHEDDKMDCWIAEAVDSCMSALSPAEWGAVQHHWHLAVVQHPRGDREIQYRSAKIRLIPMLRRRNVV